MSIERLREEIEPFLNEKELLLLEVWENDERPVLEVALGEAAHFLPKERFQALESEGKLREWCKGFVGRYRKRYYEPAAYTRRDMALYLYRNLLGVLEKLPHQWAHVCLDKVATELARQAESSEFNPDAKRLPLDLLMLRNQLILAHLTSLIVPKQKKEAESLKTVA